MLAQRIVTAVVLLMLVLLLIWLGQVWISLGILVFLGVGLWEWARLCGQSPYKHMILYAVLSALSFASQFDLGGALFHEQAVRTVNEVVTGAVSLVWLASAWLLIGRTQVLPGRAWLGAILMWCA